MRRALIANLMRLTRKEKPVSDNSDVFQALQLLFRFPEETVIEIVTVALNARNDARVALGGERHRYGLPDPGFAPAIQAAALASTEEDRYRAAYGAAHDAYSKALRS